MCFTMLPTNKFVEDVYFGAMDLANKLNKDCLLIDSSTISPLAARNLSIKLREEFGLEFLDAPVSGGVYGAENASLCFMIGAESPEIFEVVSGVTEANQGNVVADGGQLHQLLEIVGGAGRQNLQ